MTTMQTTGPVSPEFIAAGRAIFTVANPSGVHYTFRVTKSESSSSYSRPAWWVGFLTGPDNERDYTYLGRYFAETGRFELTKASKLPPESLPVRVFKWAIAVVNGRQPMLDGYTIQHEGRCGRCGRTLTTPASMEAGIGPECAKLMGKG